MHLRGDQTLVVAALAISACLSGASPARATAPTPAGLIPSEVKEAFENGLFSLPERPAGLSTSAATSIIWRVPVIMVAFAGTPLTYSAADFNLALFDATGATTTGSVYDYFQWASGGRVRVAGQVVATVQLPGTRADYAYLSWGLSTSATPNNIYGIVRDALLRCSSQVDWSPYDTDHDGYVDMLWIVHPGIGGETSTDRNDIWSITSRMSAGWRFGAAFITNQLIPGSTNQYYRLDRFSTLPEMSSLQPGARAEIGVYCHEFGHAIGLPDLYDTSNLSAATNVGPGNWSLMSTGGYGGNGFSPQFPSHPGAWASAFLGWNQTIRPLADTLITIAPLARGGQIVELWFQGEAYPEHFLIENRQREGFDRTLPNSGLLITHVDEVAIGSRIAANKINAGATPGLWLVEADGDSDLVLGRNRGDARDPFPGATGRRAIDDVTTPGTRTFSGAVTNLSLREIEPVGIDMRVRLQVRAPAWLPAEDHTDGGFEPTGFPGPARRGVIEPDGAADVVRCELRAGVPQVVLRTRRGTVWSPPLQLSASPQAALDPAIALLPGGDLAAVWSDTRGGRARILFRSRIQGSWGAEQVLADLPGDNRAPVIGCDERGLVQVAWLNVFSDLPRVYFMRFVYFAPFGQAIPVTSGPEFPGRPALAVARDGSGYVIWPDAIEVPQQYFFRRFHPDSGLSQRLPLTPLGASPQTAISVLVDGAGTLHSLWQVSGAGSSELRYQRRPKTTHPSPRDTTIDARGAPITDPYLAVDPEGGVHFAFETTTATGQQVYYKRWRPGVGWDFRCTEVGSTAEGSASSPILLPFTMGNVTVAYIAYPDAQARLMVRDRRLDGADPLAVPRISVAPPAWLSLAPNPLRPGRALELRFGGAIPREGPVVEFLDLAGRRVTALPLEREGEIWRARLEPTITARWAPGIYFARLKGARAAVARLVLLR